MAAEVDNAATVRSVAAEVEFAVMVRGAADSKILRRDNHAC